MGTIIINDKTISASEKERGEIERESSEQGAGKGGGWECQNRI
jgi:hypothetical protein